MQIVLGCGIDLPVQAQAGLEGESLPIPHQGGLDGRDVARGLKEDLIKFGFLIMETRPLFGAGFLFSRTG